MFGPLTTRGFTLLNGVYWNPPFKDPKRMAAKASRAYSNSMSFFTPAW